ncbi:hypothetical protein GCM10011609_28200 [Lentzea pudingi]|uniref:Uncharacterized protein n=1 Tax=Lentzea pudingi TaxID=1789439 RepID=A0ABQ2HRP2_9PSEU|nr:hypothetical protein GCM10011609_28200 [Lentzea pudingi]
MREPSSDPDSVGVVAPENLRLRYGELFKLRDRAGKITGFCSHHCEIVACTQHRRMLRVQDLHLISKQRFKLGDRPHEVAV